MKRSPPAVAAGTPLRVLVVEDNKDDLHLLLHELGRGGYAVDHTWVSTLDGLRHALADEWDLAVSDFSLPGMTAHDVLRQIRTMRPDLPCLVVSGTISEEQAVDVLRAGACDFIVKDRMARLLPSIEREIRESRERQRLRGAEARLQEMRQRMQFALDSVGVGFWEWDVHSNRTIWSDVMERLHGLQPETFNGTFDAFVAAVHPDDRPATLQALTQAKAGADGARIEYRALWADGSVHSIVGIGRMFRDAAGVPAGVSGVSMDITTQKQLEEQFREAQKMESIGNLAGGVAHDFNNLLTIIVGYCDLAAESLQTDADAVESLEGIRTAAVSATALTRQLLTFSRRQVVTPRVLNLNDTITGFSKILRRLLEENVELDIRLAPSVPLVCIDPSQIEQVLLNLTANARDAMRNGGRLTIETRNSCLHDGNVSVPPDERAGEYLLLSVADTGCGMPPDVQARLFEPFFTTKARGHGTGLGLATVYGIVKQSGGHIVVGSQPGAGTTFRIYLPAVGEARGSESAPATPGTGQLTGSETILIVEDNASLRRLNERILQRYGYRVLLASDGEQARQVCARHRGHIHLVLVDVIMPGDSGPAVGEWIAEHYPEVKVIYMSGYTGDAIDHHFVRRQPRAFLQKPFDAAQLARAVRDALAPHESGPAN